MNNLSNNNKSLNIWLVIFLFLNLIALSISLTLWIILIPTIKSVLSGQTVWIHNGLIVRAVAFFSGCIFVLFFIIFIILVSIRLHRYISYKKIIKRNNKKHEEIDFDLKYPNNPINKTFSNTNIRNNDFKTRQDINYSNGFHNNKFNSHSNNRFENQEANKFFYPNNNQNLDNKYRNNNVQTNNQNPNNRNDLLNNQNKKDNTSDFIYYSKKPQKN